MAESAVPKVPRDGSLTIEDGTSPTPNSLTVQYSDAVTFNEKITEAIHVFNRGTRVYTRKGNEGIPQITFNYVMASFTDGTDVTAWDALTQQGGASGWTTVGSDVEHYTVKLTFTAEGTDFGDDADHTAVASYARVTDIQFAEGEPNTVSVTMEMLGAWTYTGGA